MNKKKNQITFQKMMGHLKTILHHKRLVREGCFKAGIYWQGITHDLSKFSPTEFWVGARYFQGDRSPNNAQREDIGLSTAWLHHKGRNKHHIEYWIDYGLDEGSTMIGMKMPVRYVVEMFCDRVDASKIYKKDAYTDRSPLEYYMKGKGKHMLHPYSKKQLERLLYMLAEKGEEETFAYARRYMKAYRKYLRRRKSKSKMIS